MTQIIKYKIKSPIGSIINKDVMTEEEIRKFLPTLIMDDDQSYIWREKAEKDTIEELIEWLTTAGYEVTPIE